MILLKILSVWVIMVEITLCLSPTALLAIAKLQNTKMKAVASRLNRKVKNDYKIAKSKLQKTFLGERFSRQVQARNGFDDPYAENVPFKQEELVKSGEDNYSKEEKNKPGFQDQSYYSPENEDHYYESEDEYNYRSANPNQLYNDIPLFYQQFPFAHQQGSNIGIKVKGEPGINVDIEMGRERSSVPTYNENGEMTARLANNNAHLSKEDTNLVKNSLLDKESETDQNPNNEDRRLRTFHMLPFTPFIPPPVQPEYQNPYHFDPYKPENKKDMVKFLDGQKKMWENIWTKPHIDKIHYNGPKHLPKPSLKPEEPNYPASGEDKPAEYSSYVDYGKPENYAENYYNNYDKPNYNYGYPVVKPPLPTVFPIKVSPKIQHGKVSNLLNIKHDHVDNLLEGLHEQGELIFDMLRPFTTHIDSRVLHQLQHLYNLNEFNPSLLEGYTRSIVDQQENGGQQLSKGISGLENQQPAEGLVNNLPEGFVGEPLHPPDNHFQVIPTSKMNDPSNPVVSHIIRVPYNNFRRFRRSTTYSVADKNYINKLIEEGTEILNVLKQLAKNNNEVKLLGGFGESVLNNMKNKMNKKVEKRSSEAVKHLLMDPSIKVDVSKTLENLGTFVKTMFEHEDTPMYHVRNLVGSAKDVALATIKIPNQNIITPSKYDIVDNPKENYVLTSEVPDLSSRFGEEDEINPFWPQEMVSSTFQQVGQMIRNSVRSSQEAINHVGEITNHAKKAIHAAKNAPDLLLKTITPLPLVPDKQHVEINSRFGEDDDVVGETKNKPAGKFVKLGNLLDAVGISSPDADFPRNSENDGYVNKIWKNINGVTKSLGVDDIHDFIMEMKEKFRELKENNPLQIKQIQCGKKIFKRNADDNFPVPQFSEQETHFDPMQIDNERLGISFIPIELRHPFLNFNPSGFRSTNFEEDRTADGVDEIVGTPAQRECSMNQFGSWRCPGDQIVSYPQIMEELSNENYLGSSWDLSNQEMTKQLSDNEKLSHIQQLQPVLMTPNKEMVHKHVTDAGEPDNDEGAATMMKVTGRMLHPFTSLADEEKNHKFHKQLQPNYYYPFSYDGDNYGYPYYR